MAQVSKINMGGIDYDIRDRLLAQEVTEEIADLENKVEQNLSELEQVISEQIENYKPIEIIGDVTNAADEEDLTSENNFLKLKNRNALNGMGYVILRTKNTFEEQVTLPNTIYIIRYDFDLANKQIALPNNSVLFFDGGCVKNGTLVGQNTKIASNAKCFVNTLLLGTYVGACHTKWFADYSTISVENGFVISKNDTTSQLQYALDSSFSTIYFDSGLYYITESLVVSDAKELHLEGGATSQYLYQKQSNLQNKTIVFTDKNISLLVVRPNQSGQAKRVSIHGGNFDASLCDEPYTSSCISIDITNDRKIWGLSVDSGLWGKYSYIGAPNGIGVGFLTDNKSGYATMIRIGGIIQWFNKGVVALTNGTCWITDISITSEFSNVATVLETNTDTYIESSVQSSIFLTEAEKDTPVLLIKGGKVVVSGMIWDLKHTREVDGVKLYNNIYLAEIHNSPTIQLLGKVKSIYENRLDEYVKGDRSSFFVGNIINTERLNVLPSCESNCLEALHERGGSVSIQTYTQNGEVIDSPSVELENLFKISSDCVHYAPSSYSNNDAEITITLPDNTLLNLLSFAVFSKSKEVAMENVEVTIILNNDSTSVVRTMPVYKEIQFFYVRHGYGYAVKEVKIRFCKIKSAFFISPLIGNAPSTGYINNLGCTFLPISGGVVYGESSFQKGIMTPKVGVGSLSIMDESGDLKINDTILPLTKRAISYSGKPTKKPFLKLVNNTNPAFACVDIMIYSFVGVDYIKYAIYRLVANGFTGSSNLRYYRLSGNTDYDLIFYKSNDSNINYIVSLNNENKYEEGATRVQLLGTSFEGVSYVSQTDDEVLAQGYVVYSPTFISNIGATRPSKYAIGIGYQFFDSSLGKPIWYNGDGKWVDATGAIV